MTAQTDTGVMALADRIEASVRGLEDTCWLSTTDRMRIVAALRSASQPGRDLLRSFCNAGGELGCSCADQNYQWFGPACQSVMAQAFKQLLKSDAILALSAPAPQDRTATIDECMDVVRQWTAPKWNDLVNNVLADLEALKSWEGK
jgi:hypothetical protein